MRKTLALAGIVALVLALALAAGCSKKAPETVTCAGCGMEVAKTEAHMIDGKPYCAHCAAKMEHEEQGEAEHPAGGEHPQGTEHPSGGEQQQESGHDHG